jgi:hypothetical protein
MNNNNLILKNEDLDIIGNVPLDTVDLERLMSGLEDAAKNSDQMNNLEQYVLDHPSESSIFTENFPNFSENASSVILIHFIKEKGLNTIFKVKKSPTDEESQALNNKLIGMQKEVDDLTAKIETNVVFNDAENIINVAKDIQLKAEKYADIFTNYQDIFKIGITGAITLSPILAYKSLFTLYTNKVLPEMDKLAKLNPRKYRDLVQLRKNTITKFNLFTIPLFAIVY